MTINLRWAVTENTVLQQTGMDPRFAVKRMKQYVFVLFLLTFFFHVSAESQLSLNAGGVERVELAGLLVNIMDSRDQPNYIDMVLNEYTTDKKTQQSVLVGQNICRYTTPLPRQRAPENSVCMLLINQCDIICDKA